MVDWAKPELSDTHTDELAATKARDVSNARMDYTGDNNIPTGAKRLNPAQAYRVEEWDGTAWIGITPPLADLLAASGNLAEVNAAAARENLEVPPNSRLISTGDGLTGGGDLSANRTLNVNNSVVRTSRTLSGGDGLTGGGDLSENRTLSVDSSVVRTSRAISAGDGLTGGGNLTANRTLSVNSSVLRTSDLASNGGTIQDSPSGQSVRVYRSSQITIAPNVIRTVNHGLGGMPALAFVRLYCVTAELGYSAGQETTPYMYEGDSDGGWLPVRATTSQLAVATGDRPLYVQRFTTADTADWEVITASRWRMILVGIR